MRLLTLLLPLVSLAGGKTKKWVRGQRGLVRKYEALFKNNNDDIIWFHCASLGEFEQGRSLIEDMRNSYPKYKILLTFFSPSGYEIRKDYEGVDYVLYLPIDTRTSARRIVRAINPKIVIFIKYEFWTNILKECKRCGAKLYVVSAIFNRKQQFFKWWGSYCINTLRLFNQIFVQNKESVKLLKTIDIIDVTIAGDTRFDRVYTLATGAKQIEQMEHFSDSDREIFVAGSTWGEDDRIILETISKYPKLKFVIVPHEITLQKINDIKEDCENMGRSTILYSNNCGAEVLKCADIMIIDKIGILSSTYRYATMAYIGGGFGVGIHNTLEAATYGLPISFGPNYSRFAEARDLISLEAAKSVLNSDELSKWIKSLLSDNEMLQKCAYSSRNYVSSKIGATKIITDFIANDIKIRI